MFELHLALVSDHRAVAGHNGRLGQLNLHEVRVLERERLPGFDLSELVEPLAHVRHAVTPPESRPATIAPSPPSATRSPAWWFVSPITARTSPRFGLIRAAAADAPGQPRLPPLRSGAVQCP